MYVTIHSFFNSWGGSISKAFKSGFFVCRSNHLKLACNILHCLKLSKGSCEENIEEFDIIYKKIIVFNDL